MSKSKKLDPRVIKEQLRDYFSKVSPEQFAEDDKQANPREYGPCTTSEEETELTKFLKETDPEPEPERS